MSDIYVLREPLAISVDGVPTVLNAGTTVRAGHKILVGRERMFAPLTVDYDVEPAAVAAPKVEAPKVRRGKAAGD